MKANFTNSLMALNLVLLIGLTGCKEQIDEPQAQATPEEQIAQLPSRALEQAIYNPSTESWMVPQKDPYALDNMQQAYDNLLAGKYARVLTRSQSSEFSGAHQLEPTHYCLKIYPRNEAEQWEVELMEDVKVAYIPFDYVQLTEAEVQRVSAMTRASDANTFDEVSHHSVTDDYTSAEGETQTVTQVMPVLYVVWPCNKPLPQQMDYVVDYPVLIPPHNTSTTRSATGLNTVALQAVETEAISLALGIPASPQVMTMTVDDRIRMINGTVLYYDTSLKANVPQANLKQRVQLGSNIWEDYSDSNGYFMMEGQIPNEATYYHVFQHPKWKITTASSTSPHVVNWGSVGTWWPYFGSWAITMHPTSSLPIYLINPAVNYFYNGSHSISTWSYADGIRIIALAETPEYTNGSFHSSKSENAYIKIYNKHQDKTARLAGTVLHELGHFTHYCERGSSTKFHNVNTLIKESFASYVGWHVGENYYSSLGYIKESSGEDITGNNQQSWTPDTWFDFGNGNDLKFYSPLFVDLIDTHNQGEGKYSGYLIETVSKLPHSIIKSIAAESTSWSSIKAKLQQYIGVCYTQDQFDEYCLPYDYWFARN